MTPVPRTRRLTVIGAPSSAGAYGPGQEHAPAAFRRYGLLPRLRDSGIDVVDRGDGTLRPWSVDETTPSASNVGSVMDTVRELADAVDDALAQDDAVLVLGGDCTVEIGTVAGAVRDGSSVALAYIDLDADLNTPQTGDGVLDWMGVAHLLDVPGAHDGLASTGSRRPLLEPAAVRLFGTDNITEPEQSVIDRLALVVEPLAAVRDDPEGVAARTADWARRFDRLLVHVDADVLEFDAFPIAENTRRLPGLDLPGLTRLLRDLCGLPSWRALTLAEINPEHAPDQRSSFDALISSLTDVLRPR